MVQQIYQSLGEGDDVLLIFLDVSKAFDRVYHEGLLYKLQRIGICDNLLQWFKSYLAGRNQRVVLNGNHSEWKPINSGVPQASILGPLLFLVFVDDIVDDLSCDPFLYADDTTLYKPLKHQDDILNVEADLQMISNWAAQWRVIFNAAKTEYMIISKKTVRPQQVEILFQGTAIKHVTSHCHLGFWLMDNMSWAKHTQNLVKKVSVSINLMKRMPGSINRKTKLEVYKFYIRPLLEYGTSVFGGNLTQEQTDILEQTQRHAVICALNAYRHTSHNKLLIEAGIEPLMVRRRYFGLCHLYKMIHGLVPLYLRNLLPGRVGDFSPYPLRNVNDFNIPRVTKTYIKLSFFWHMLYSWNALELNIRISESLIIFKSNLKLLMFSKQNLLFDIYTPKGSVHHSRMRMGLSGLNAHRKKYNFID